MKNRRWVLFSLVAIAIFSRFLPHPWNWTAIGASAIFAGSRFDSLKEALFVPIAALAITDLVFGWHPTMAYVYGAIALTVLACWAFRASIKGAMILPAVFFSSTFFFFVTNFGVWMSGGMYPMTSTGLMECLLAGLPFFGWQLGGDLFYSGILFGAWAFAQARYPELAEARS